MRKKNKRLMIVRYRNEADVGRLDTCLKMCCMPHVILKECEFTDGSAQWIIYIDRGRHTWEKVMREVNRVHAVSSAIPAAESTSRTATLLCR